MPVLNCPRCQRANPEVAVYCYFDGADLHGRQDGQAFNRLAQDYVFPSGRCCRTYDDFAQACRDEWGVARDLLRQGVFRQFFGSSGRADLARAAQEAMAQADADIALTTFLGALPVLQIPAPKLDINPRRFLLGNLLAGEHRTLQLIVSNQGQGVLQGTLSVVEGSDWFKIEGATGNQLPIITPREQKISLKVETRGLPAGQTYGAKLTVITNGGVVEVLARMDLVAQPFAKAPFQGVKTPREMAERMRAQPKAAGPILETGEVSRWFTSNGWDFPVRGQQARGVAGVQQFFETMGLSKPPVVKLSQSELRFGCNYPEPVRFQLHLQTHSRKWVYGHVISEAPWLKVLTPLVSGPQQATISLEVDPTGINNGPQVEGKARVVANAGQTLPIKVLVDVNGLPATILKSRRVKGRAAASGWLQPVLAMAAAFFLLRLGFVLFVDTGMRSAAVLEATHRLASLDSENIKGTPQAQGIGAWLRLPWPRILSGGTGSLDAKLLNDQMEGTVPVTEFQDYFVRYFLRWFVLFTWWLGALAGAVVVWRRGGGPGDLFWGLVAGAGAGLACSATLGCAFLLGEIVPHALWAGAFGSSIGGGLVSWLVWVLIALVAWTLLGAAVGFALNLVTPLQRIVLKPVQRVMAGLFRMCGLAGLAQRCAA